jgi:hypothetical protein
MKTSITTFFITILFKSEVDVSKIAALFIKLFNTLSNSYFLQLIIKTNISPARAKIKFLFILIITGFTILLNHPKTCTHTLTKPNEVGQEYIAFEGNIKSRDFRVLHACYRFYRALHILLLLVLSCILTINTSIPKGNDITNFKLHLTDSTG